MFTCIYRCFSEFEMIDLHFNLSDQSLWDEYRDRAMRLNTDSEIEFPEMASSNPEIWLRLFLLVDTGEFLIQHPDALAHTTPEIQAFEGKILDRRTKDVLASTRR